MRLSWRKTTEAYSSRWAPTVTISAGGIQDHPVRGVMLSADWLYLGLGFWD
jgi:hypothetical protein